MAPPKPEPPPAAPPKAPPAAPVVPPQAPPKPEPVGAKPVPPKAPERPAPPPKPEVVARAALPPKRSPLPLVIGGVVVIVAGLVGFLVMSSSKKASQVAEVTKAREDSLRAVQLARAREDSLKRVLEAAASSSIAALREKLAEAERLQAQTRAKGDYDQALAELEEAVRLTTQGSHEAARLRAQAGLERIESAIDRSRRIQEREDLAKRDRDQALARLRAEVTALSESVAVLKRDRGTAFAGAQLQQLEQIVQKARQFVDAENITGGQEQVSYGYDMVSKVRFAITDGKRQEAEAQRLLRERQEQARRDSIQRAELAKQQLAQPPTEPVAVKRVPAVYPPAARAANVQGTVEIEFEVGVDGRARDFKVVKSLGAGCDEAAIEALKQWEFKPGTQGGKPVPVRIKLPFVFRKQ